MAFWNKTQTSAPTPKHRPLSETAPKISIKPRTGSTDDDPKGTVVYDRQRGGYYPVGQ